MENTISSYAIISDMFGGRSYLGNVVFIAKKQMEKPGWKADDVLMNNHQRKNVEHSLVVEDGEVET